MDTAFSARSAISCPCFINIHPSAFFQSRELSEIAAKVASLSPRERQVLEGVVAGKPNKIIAYDLEISPRTVEVYRANLMTKMLADSVSDLVRMVIVADRT